MKPDVMGANEVANLLGVSRQRVAILAAQTGFPEGLELGRGTVWDGPTMRAYAQDRLDPHNARNEGRRNMRMLDTYRRTASLSAAAKTARMSWDTARDRLTEYGVILTPEDAADKRDQGALIRKGQNR